MITEVIKAGVVSLQCNNCGAIQIQLPLPFFMFRTGICEEVDSVAVSVPVANGPRIIAIYCGSKRPQKLMSNDVNLVVTFVSHATSSTSSAKGFTAVYNFVTGKLVVT